MISIQNTLISEDILEKKFVCDLTACKGACCVEGDSGAPLEKKELKKLETVFEEVKPYLNKKGLKAIEKQGLFVVDSDGDYTTPLVAAGKECAYVIFDETNTAKCAIEMAFLDGKIKWQKPISCHLYPIRITSYKHYDAVNYHSWDICKPACSCGEKLNVPVYKFLKNPLIRKYGKSWFEELQIAATEWEKAQTKTKNHK